MCSDFFYSMSDTLRVNLGKKKKKECYCSKTVHVHVLKMEKQQLSIYFGYVFDGRFR